MHYFFLSNCLFIFLEWIFVSDKRRKCLSASGKPMFLCLVIPCGVCTCKRFIIKYLHYRNATGSKSTEPIFISGNLLYLRFCVCVHRKLLRQKQLFETAIVSQLISVYAWLCAQNILCANIAALQSSYTKHRHRYIIIRPKYINS